MISPSTHTALGEPAQAPDPVPGAGMTTIALLGSGAALTRDVSSRITYEEYAKFHCGSCPALKLSLPGRFFLERSHVLLVLSSSCLVPKRTPHRIGAWISPPRQRSIRRART